MIWVKNIWKYAYFDALHSVTALHHSNVRTSVSAGNYLMILAFEYIHHVENFVVNLIQSQHTVNDWTEMLGWVHGAHIKLYGISDSLIFKQFNLCFSWPDIKSDENREQS